MTLSAEDRRKITQTTGAKVLWFGVHPAVVTGHYDDDVVYIRTHPEALAFTVRTEDLTLVTEEEN